MTATSFASGVTGRTSSALDNGRLVDGRDLELTDDHRQFFAWDRAAARPVPYDTTTGRYDSNTSDLALEGEYRIATSRGEIICHPAFELYRRLCSHYAPEAVESITWIPRAQLE